MNSRRILSLVAVVAASFLATGCMTPYLKRAPNTPDPKPAPALVTGFLVRFDSSVHDKSVFDAAVDAIQNSQLDDFGKRAANRLEEVLATHGYTVAWDGQRTFKLDAIQLASTSATAALTGHWRHPEASSWSPDAVDSLFVKPMDVISKVKLDGQSEFFAFVEVSIRDGGLFVKEPVVLVRTSVFDGNGRKVLDLRGLGEGDGQFMYADRSPENLMRALDRGFESLKAAQEEPL